MLECSATRKENSNARGRNGEDVYAARVIRADEDRIEFWIKRSALRMPIYAIHSDATDSGVYRVRYA